MVAQLGLVTIAFFTAGAGSAQTPPQDFFTGQYRMIGIANSGAVDLRLRIDPVDKGFSVTACDGTTGRLDYDDGFEWVFLTGSVGKVALNCQYFVDNDNYPLLACYGATGARLTLWPDNTGPTDEPLDCAIGPSQ